MHIRIEGVDLPGRSCGPSNDVPDGYRNIHVGIARRGKRDELLGLTPGDAPAASWTFECRLSGDGDPAGIAPDVKGPYIQGPPGGRFIYLNWVTIDDAGTPTLFRRAKLWLDGVPPTILAEAARTGLLVGRLGLDRPKGQSNLLRAAADNRMVRWHLLTWHTTGAQPENQSRREASRRAA